MKCKCEVCQKAQEYIDKYGFPDGFRAVAMNDMKAGTPLHLHHIGWVKDITVKRKKKEVKDG